MPNLAFVFPGQGSQYVGMGRELYSAYSASRDIYDEADEALGLRLRQLCFEGPETELRQTVNAQPALLVTSLAVWAAIKEETAKLPEVAYFAGHSVGEYSALVAAGALRFTDALMLVRERGRLMQAAGESQPGGMSAILGLDEKRIEQVCREAMAHGIVVVANYNAPGQVVISGQNPALARAAELAKTAGARRVLPLPVSGAFHSPLVAPAATSLKAKLEATTFFDSQHRIFSNVTGLCYANASEMPERLAQQMTSPVLWTACVRGMAEGGARCLVEVGPGQVLAGLVKRTVTIDKVMSVGAPEGVCEFAYWLGGQPA